MLGVISDKLVLHIIIEIADGKKHSVAVFLNFLFERFDNVYILFADRLGDYNGDNGLVIS